MKPSKITAFSGYWLLLFTLAAGLLASPARALPATTAVIPDVSLKAAANGTQSKRPTPATTTFNQHEITASPVANLSELFQQEQSTIRLTNTSGDASQTALSIRGFGDNAAANSLILVDGFPLINPSLLAPNFNSIPLSDIKRIEIIQGSKGSLWGDQAVGGVVNIITRHPEKLFAGGIVSGGSFNNQYYNLIAGDKFKNGVFIKSFAVLAKTDNDRAHNQIQSSNVAAQAGVDYARGMTLVNLQTYNNTTHFPGGLTFAQLQQNPSQAVNTNYVSTYRTNLVQLLNRQEFSADWLLETRISQYTTNGSGRIFIPFTRSDTVFRVSPRLIGRVRDSKLTLGYDGSGTRFRLMNSKVHAHTSAQQNDVYLQAVTPLSPQLDLTLGVRGAAQSNHISAAKNQAFNTTNKILVTEQGLHYRINDSLSAYVRRDGNFSFPKANEEISAVSVHDSLRAQTGVSYETGTVWKTEKWLTQLNIFHLPLHNEIAFNPQQTAAQPFGAWTNLDDTVRNGATLALDHDITVNAALNLQINYVHATFASGSHSGNFIPAVPAVTGNAGLQYQFTERWQTRYFLTYTGSRYASEDVTNTSSRLGSYWLHNAAIQYAHSAYFVNLEVMNIFNKVYAAYAYYNPNVGGNLYYPAAGRSFLISFKLNID